MRVMKFSTAKCIEEAEAIGKSQERQARSGEGRQSEPADACPRGRVGGSGSCTNGRCQLNPSR
jgi:hypothetical protein